jgi:hypothetical protein
MGTSKEAVRAGKEQYNRKLKEISSGETEIAGSEGNQCEVGVSNQEKSEENE